VDIGTICAEVSEVILMTAHNRWRNSYISAMHSRGNTNFQERKTNIATGACVERLGQTDLKEATEQEEIHTALAGLNVLKNV
jgi:hypothetical protein